jgi:protease II
MLLQLQFYGARGANGVVIITAKLVKLEAKVTYNMFVGVRTLAKKLNVLDPYDFVLYNYERSRGSSTDSSSLPISLELLGIR